MTAQPAEHAGDRPADQYTERDRHHRRHRGESASRRPLLSPSRSVATPTSPSAPGTSSQKAGVKLTIAGGPVRCRATRAATGVIAAAPTKADKTPPRKQAADHLGAVGDVENQQDPGQRRGRAQRFRTTPSPKTATANQGPMARAASRPASDRAPGMPTRAAARDDAEGEQHQLHRAGGQPAGPGDHLVGGQLDHRGGQLRARATAAPAGRSGTAGRRIRGWSGRAGTPTAPTTNAAVTVTSTWIAGGSRAPASWSAPTNTPSRAEMPIASSEPPSSTASPAEVSTWPISCTAGGYGGGSARISGDLGRPRPSAC